MVATKLSDCVAVGVRKCLLDGLVSLYITRACVGKAVYIYIAAEAKDKNHHQNMVSCLYVTIGRASIPYNCVKVMLMISTYLLGYVQHVCFEFFGYCQPRIGSPLALTHELRTKCGL